MTSNLKVIVSPWYATGGPVFTTVPPGRSFVFVIVQVASSPSAISPEQPDNSFANVLGPPDSPTANAPASSVIVRPVSVPGKCASLAFAAVTSVWNADGWTALAPLLTTRVRPSAWARCHRW